MNVIFCLLIVTTASTYAKYLQSAQFAQPCDESQCILPDCACSSNISPLDKTIPQLVTLSFDESVQPYLYETYYKPILFDRKNPDGNPISATFYVPHVYSDYRTVNQLYNKGFEIALHSISKNVLQSYWQTATLETLLQEFGGERQLISRFANVPLESLRGARTPHLQFNGDASFEAYRQSGILYDNSWPTYASEPLFPYTLDYQTNQACMTPLCPESSFPGQWVLPIINFRNEEENHECNVMVSCRVNGTAQRQFEWLKEQFLHTYSNNRAPLNLIVTSQWFIFIENSLEAYVMFLDYLGGLSDVFLVSNHQVYNWARNPVSVEEFSSAQTIEAAPCDYNLNCELGHGNETRYMGSCVPCPRVYPWLDNHLGE